MSLLTGLSKSLSRYKKIWNFNLTRAEILLESSKRNSTVLLDKRKRMLVIYGRGWHPIQKVDIHSIWGESGASKSHICSLDRNRYSLSHYIFFPAAIERIMSFILWLYYVTSYISSLAGTYNYIPLPSCTKSYNFLRHIQYFTLK